MTRLFNWFKNLTQKSEESCLGCGECCRQFSWHLHVSSRDVERWRELGRKDLLAQVNELGWIWHDPKTQQRLPVCPYLKETAPDKALCGIHDIKPDICRAYPTYETHHQCVRGIHINSIWGGPILLPLADLLEDVLGSPLLPIAELLF